jgi:hypothetical protein
MSGAAMSRESMRPVLPFVREAAADRAETAGCRAGAAGLPPYHPASAPADHHLLGEDPGHCGGRPTGGDFAGPFRRGLRGAAG